MSNNDEAKSKRKSTMGNELPKHLQKMSLNAAGIDIGSEEHYVAVPGDRDKEPVRRFKCFTADLYQMADWLEGCGIETVAMESTGVYWIPVFQVLESRGFEVKLINARNIKNMPGRKTDVKDAQWIQELHTYGLLTGSFRPTEQICQLRCYIRQRDRLTEYCSAHIQHMQKAMIQMNIQLHKVMSDITGVSGMRIIRAIVSGERDPNKLADMKHPLIQAPRNEIVKALQGDWRPEHLFCLAQALKLYDFYRQQIIECDEQIRNQIEQFDFKVDVNAKPLRKKTTKTHIKNAVSFDLRTHLYQMSGVDLTMIDGIDGLTALTIISEWGLDMGKFKTEKHLGSWLGLSPNHRITGGNIKSSKTKNVVNRSATALRRSAQTLLRSTSALGAFYRRMRSRLGAPKAITAAAYKLARICYRLLKFGEEYVDQGQNYYEERYKERALHNLKKRAQDMGFLLVPKNIVTPNLVTI